MSELEKYIAKKKPVKSSMLVISEMEAKSKELVDRFIPDPDKTKYEQICLLGMYELLELIYN